MHSLADEHSCDMLRGMHTKTQRAIDVFRLRGMHTKTQRAIGVGMRACVCMHVDEALVCVCASACGRSVGMRVCACMWTKRWYACVRVHVGLALVCIICLSWKMALHKRYHNLSDRYKIFTMVLENVHTITGGHS